MIIKPIISSMFILSLLSVFGLNLAGTSSTGQYLVPTADFTVMNSNCMYINYGNSLYIDHDDNYCSFVSGIRLPDGVTVTKITMYWADFEEIENIQATISRSTFLGMEEELSSLYSTLHSDATSSDVVTSFVIDNANYEYFIRVGLPTANLILFGFRIEYTNQSFLSLIRR